MAVRQRSITECHQFSILFFSLLQIGNALALNFPVFFDSSNHLHRCLQYHPEQPARIDACIAALKEYRIENSVVDLIDVSDEHNPCRPEELRYARDKLVKAHSEEYVSQLERRCRDSRQRRIDDGKNPLGFVGYVDDDTYLTTETYDVCLRATACWIRAVDYAVGYKNGSPGASMALTRPPGHHATARLSNGFCLFNFCAAAALHAVDQDPSTKVSILDWDVHMGQGIVDIFKGHDRIRYASIHQIPAFPYMGEKKEVTNGNIFTIPIQADTTWTCGYQQALENDALPFLINASWQPDLVIISAGYDALDSDELASVSLTASDYGKATRLLLEKMNNNPGLVLGLEGGYQLKDMAAGGNLQEAVVETVKAVVEQQRRI